MNDFEFVDLQYGDTQAERAALETKLSVQVRHLDEIDNFKDIDGLAALISACDVVVTVSNTTAHIACALGKPVYVLLPYANGLHWYCGTKAERIARGTRPPSCTGKTKRAIGVGWWSAWRRICDMAGTPIGWFPTVSNPP